MQSLSSLVAPQIVITTTCGTITDNTVGTVTTLGFQRWRWLGSGSAHITGILNVCENIYQFMFQDINSYETERATVILCGFPVTRDDEGSQQTDSNASTRLSRLQFNPRWICRRLSKRQTVLCTFLWQYSGLFQCRHLNEACHLAGIVGAIILVPCHVIKYLQLIWCVNSLWPNDAIWRHRSWSTLAQVMACCLMAPSHYLNQCWAIFSKVQWHSNESNLTRDSSPPNH